MIALAIEALAASAALMLAVLALRGPVRRAFGPEMAYALWAIPALRLILPPLPAAWRKSVSTPIVDMGQQASVLIAPYVDVAPDLTLPEASPLETLAPIAAALWAAGATAFLLWQLARYWRFRSALMRAAVPLDRAGAVAIVESAAATGPLAFGIVHRVVAFPCDFAERYDERERALALAHELGHHRRGDLYANWVALAVLALHWFNPLAWLAYRAFRADQEMANDAGVIARLGAGARHAYGCAIVKAAHGSALTPACHLHTIKDLKGRPRMLGRARASRTRRATGGVLGVALSLGALGVTASGTQAAERVRARVETVTGVELAALDAAAFQAPSSPPATAPAPAVAPQADPAPTKKVRRVTVVRDGRTETFEGEAADAFIAANPVPVPPTPPAPPAPVTGAVHAAPAVPAVPVIAERNCGTAEGQERRQMVIRRQRDGHSVTVICTDRIAAAANARSATIAAARAEAAGRRAEAEGRRAEAQAAWATRHAEQTHRQAMTSALAGMERARARLERNDGLQGQHRAEALRGLDEAMAEMRRELAEIGRD